MHLKDILNELFPGRDVLVQDEGAFEVTGLAPGVEPSNCEVLLRGSDSLVPGYRREYFLVRCHGAMLFFRICSAGISAGYQDYVVGAGAALAEANQQQLQLFAGERIAAYCQAV